MSTNNILDQHQKMTLAMVIIIAIVSLVIGAFYLRKNLFAPFLRTGTMEFKTSDQLEKERVAALKTKDTDGDAISDFDELYIYRTSPYLDDTDSDGKTDSVEIADNSDPNCPEGQQCRQTAVVKPTPTVAPDATQPNTSNGTAPATTTTPTTGTPTGNGTVTGMDKASQAVYSIFGDVRYLTPAGAAERVQALPAAQIREFFLTMGLDKAQVEKYSDEQLRVALLQSVNEIIQSQGKANGATTPPATGTTPAPTQP